MQELTSSSVGTASVEVPAVVATDRDRDGITGDAAQRLAGQSGGEILHRRSGSR
jgi:hypothetical protein